MVRSRAGAVFVRFVIGARSVSWLRRAFLWRWPPSVSLLMRLRLRLALDPTLLPFLDATDNASESE